MYGSRRDEVEITADRFLGVSRFWQRVENIGIIIEEIAQQCAMDNDVQRTLVRE